MTDVAIKSRLKSQLSKFLGEQESPELIVAYLFYLEKAHKLEPVLFPRERKIYKNAIDAVKALEEQNKLCHETEIKISFGERAVDEQTTKIYICPFTGKVFGDNTHPNPQDAIYDWVSKCKENTERSAGLRVKRFYISDDLEVIKNYIPKDKPREPILKVVYTSALSGKLFNSRDAVIEDFRRHYLKKLSLVEAQNQDRFEIEESFLNFLQEELVEDKVASFVEALSEYEEFHPYIEQWVEAE